MTLFTILCINIFADFARGFLVNGSGMKHLLRMMSRQEFLAQKWQRYPLLQEGSTFQGRIQTFQQGVKWEVALSREGKSEQRQFDSLVMQEAPGIDACRILVVGDIVAITADGVVTLLAPQLGPQPNRTFRPEYLRLWPEFIHHVRAFFRDLNFLELTTPNLVLCPGTEPSLDYFRTEFVRGSKTEKLYLPTSPELHLKKALTLGGERIFEIKTCFRNGEVTQHHQPEFTMIEWYRAYEGLASIQQDVANLVKYLVLKMPGLKAPAAYDHFTMRQLFQVHCKFDLKPETGIEQLKLLAESLGVDVRSATEIDDYFFLIFMSRIETALAPERMVFVEEYPPYQAALARLTEEGWGDRFEVYWRGLEIANAFHELNDPGVQRARFAEDLEKKRKMKKESIPLDQEFLQCLEAGMPPSSGIALGLERLFMALTGLTQIAETRLFPIQ